MIPDSKREAVRRALARVFGAPDVDDITPLTGGLSTALVFRIVVRGEAYLLRLVMPGAPAGGDPARQFACMRFCGQRRDCAARALRERGRSAAPAHRLR